MKRHFFLIILLMPLYFQSNPSAHAEVRALLVGVAQYQNLQDNCRQEYCNLKGPVNDVLDLKHSLMRDLGIPEEQIKTLTNHEASRKNIEQTFHKWLMSEKTGLAIFYFSGHGSQPQYRNPITGQVESLTAILPYDTIPKGGLNIIVNKELGNWVHNIKGKAIWVIIDSCYSEGMTTRRVMDKDYPLGSVPSVRNRYVSITDYQPPPGILAIPRSLEVPANAIYMTASRKDEKAVEIPTPPEGRYRGAFTLGLSEALKAPSKTTYQKLFAHAKDIVKERFRLPQDPQIKGPDDLLSQPILAEPNVEAPQKPKPPGKIEVVAARPETPSEISGDRVLLALENIEGVTPSEMKSIQGQLSALGIVSLVESSGFFDCLLRGRKMNNRYEIKFLNNVGDVNVIGSASRFDTLMPQIKGRIEYIYAVKQLAKISNPRPSFDVKVSVVERYQDEERRNFKINEYVTFKVTAKKDCYLLVINTDSEGNFNIIFPNKFHQDSFVNANTETLIPDAEMRKRKFKFKIQKPVGEETVKVIATTKRLDLQSINLSNFKNTETVRSVTDRTRKIGVVQEIEDNINSNITATTSQNTFEWSTDTITLRSYSEE